MGRKRTSALLCLAVAAAWAASAAQADSFAPGPLRPASAWLQVDSPVAASRVGYGIVEVRGRAGAGEPRSHDLVIVLDLSDSTIQASGADLDGDGPDGATDPDFLDWLRDQEEVRDGLAFRLRGTDFEDSILAAELMAADVLLSRLSLEVFRVD